VVLGLTHRSIDGFSSSIYISYNIYCYMAFGEIKGEDFMRFVILLSAFWIADAIIYPVEVVANSWVTGVFAIIAVMDIVEWLIKIRRE